MIKTLFIQDFALIDEITIDFDSRLNILTGETGAGKSIIIDAIDLAFGARASKDQIKTGRSKAFIELTINVSQSFDKTILQSNGIELEDDNTLILSREVSQNSTRSRINGSLVTQNYVQELREQLLDIHSQHETYRYLNPKTHIHLLDSYGDKNHLELVKEFKIIYKDFSDTKNQIEAAKNQFQSIEQKIDFLEFQINEISSARIEDPDEFDNLMQRRLVLLNSEELKELTYSSYSELYCQDNSVIDILNQLENKLIKASEFDSNLSRIAENISSSTINLKDAADELRNYSEKMEIDPEKLSEIEERVELLDKLKRKYGPGLNDIIFKLEAFNAELAEISINNEKIDNLRAKLNELDIKISKLSQDLSKSRNKIADTLSTLVQGELIKLEMPKVQFVIKVKYKNNITADGIDDVEFMISPNPGEPLKPLAKVASGGEISRVMLAIKTIFAKSDMINTVIFDEIDTGISGKTSQSVGEELSTLSQTHQILCVTHQPIIAAMADRHFHIQKLQENNSTTIIINTLKDNERISSISKLASGSADDPDSVGFAAKLIQQARDFKSSFSKQFELNV